MADIHSTVVDLDQMVGSLRRRSDVDTGHVLQTFSVARPERSKRRMDGQGDEIPELEDAFYGLVGHLVGLGIKVEPVHFESDGSVHDFVATRLAEEIGSLTDLGEGRREIDEIHAKLVDHQMLVTRNSPLQLKTIAELGAFVVGQVAVFEQLGVKGFIVFSAGVLVVYLLRVRFGASAAQFVNNVTAEIYVALMPKAEKAHRAAVAAGRRLFGRLPRWPRR